MSSVKFNYETEFPPLGHPEHHFNKYPKHPWLKTKGDILDWLEKNISEFNNNDYVINEDLTISRINDHGISKYATHILNSKISLLKVQFREVRSLNVHAKKLKSLIGLPFKVDHVHITSSLYLSSFVGISSKVKTITVHNCGFTNFNGMPIFDSDKVILDISNNNIVSWEGFTNVNKIKYFSPTYSKEIQDMNRGLLEEMPLSVNSVVLCLIDPNEGTESIFGINIEKEGRTIGIEALDKVQKIRIAENLKLNMEDNISKGKDSLRKRKI